MIYWAQKKKLDTLDIHLCKETGSSGTRDVGCAFSLFFLVLSSRSRAFWTLVVDVDVLCWGWVGGQCLYRITGENPRPVSWLRTRTGPAMGIFGAGDERQIAFLPPCPLRWYEMGELDPPKPSGTVVTAP